MSNKVKITADSTCDVPADVLKKYNIDLISLHINMGEKDYRDVEVGPNEIFNYYNENKKLASTSAINISDYHEFFKKYVEEGFDVVHISLSSEISSCYQNASVAASNFDNVFVVDSKNLSSGSGILALFASDLSNEGFSAKDICDKVAKAREFTNTSFVIDTLEYLHKGGRCSALAAFGANMLNLKPCIEVKNGKMGVGKKYRGKIDNVLMQYADDQLSNLKNTMNKRIFITSAGISEETQNLIKEKLDSLNKFDEVIVSTAGSAITCHCGPGTLGLIFIDNYQ